MKYLPRAAACAVVAAGLLVPTSAFGATAPGYEQFSDCPDRTALADATVCAVITVDGGHLKLGSKNTPITDEIKLVETAAPPNSVVVGSFDGGHQPVPGGLVGITGLDWLNWLFPFSLLRLDAEAELVGTPSQPFADPFTLPLRVRLESPLLNDHCYIGSSSNPITLNLTAHTTNPPPPNTPISGSPGHLGPHPTLPGVLSIDNRVIVDNAFAVPGANGCDLLGFGLINGLVNFQAGLPSPPGNNEAVQEVSANMGAIQAIYPPSGIEQ